MRALFLLLVLANLGFLAWARWYAPAQAPVSVTPARGQSAAPSLVLLSEAKAGAGREAAAGGGDPARGGSTDNAGEPPAMGESTGTASEQPDETGMAESDAVAALADRLGSSANDGAEPASETLQPEAVAEGAAEADAAVTGAAAELAEDDRTPAPRPAEPDAGAGESVEPEDALTLAAAGQRRCRSLGPYLNLPEATEAAARLRGEGYEPDQRMASGEVWVGHWVYLAPLDTRPAAIEIVESLRSSGVSDIYIIPSGEQRNAVSLGVFSQMSSARSRMEQIEAFGYQPQISDRYRNASVYWIDIELSPGQTLDPAQFQAQPSRILRLEERECE